eukprot:gene15028-6188_t
MPCLTNIWKYNNKTTNTNIRDVNALVFPVVILEKPSLLGMRKGKRRRGGPAARWMDDIKTVTKLSLKDLREATRDREKWRMKIMIIKPADRRRLDGIR